MKSSSASETSREGRRLSPLLARSVALALTLFALASPLVAVQPDEILPDPQLEMRARALSRQLRCMVCQNQSIDDSDAPLARDLRILVRERLETGDSDQQVLDFLVARYGEFVLLRPRFEPHTALLWLTPVLVLTAGAFGLLMLLRSRRKTSPERAARDADLTAEEQARLSRLTRPDGRRD